MLRIKAPLGRLTLVAAFLLGTTAQVSAADLTVTEITPNPYGVVDQLFAVTTDGQTDLLAEPVDRLVPAQGATLPTALPEGESRRVSILHFNDLHNYLTVPHRKKGTTHYFSQMVKLAKERRAAAGEEEVVLFLSAGDDMTGGVLDELLGFTPETFVVHPAYNAYIPAGVDFAVLGNHEFDRGTKLLAKALESHKQLPVLSANVHSAPDLRRNAHYYPAVIAVSKGLRIGVIGLTTREDTRLGTPENPGLEISSPLATAKALLPAVAEQSDVVVLLTHLGYGAGQHRSGKAGAARFIGEGDSALAETVSGLTDKPVVIVGGHTHTALNVEKLEELFQDVPVLQAGGHGSHLGDFQMEVALGATPVASARQAQLTRLKKADKRVKEGDEKFASLEQPGDYDQAFEELVMGPIWQRLDSKLQETIAQVNAGEDMGHDATVADRYVGEAAIANFMNDALVSASQGFSEGAVDLAAFNASGLVTGIPAQGDLSFEAWFKVMPFTDSVQVFELTGQQIQDILDSNAQRIVRPEELVGENAVNLNGYVSRGFLHFSSALRYTIELNGSAADAKAVEVMLNGKALADQLDKTFKVAFGSYIGNGGYSEAWNGKVIGAGVAGDLVGYDLKSQKKRDTGFVYRNEIVRAIREMGEITPAQGAAKDGRLQVKAANAS
ncbi:bifunctional metallophosphatase/5'-nucleotidase [Rhodovibrionaceae bacterium A322]